jgi:hypothetical protein
LTNKTYLDFWNGAAWRTVFPLIVSSAMQYRSQLLIVTWSNLDHVLTQCASHRSWLLKRLKTEYHLSRIYEFANSWHQQGPAPPCSSCSSCSYMLFLHLHAVFMSISPPTPSVKVYRIVCMKEQESRRARMVDWLLWGSRCLVPLVALSDGRADESISRISRIQEHLANTRSPCLSFPLIHATWCVDEFIWRSTTCSKSLKIWWWVWDCGLWERACGAIVSLYDPGLGFRVARKAEPLNPKSKTKKNKGCISRSTNCSKSCEILMWFRFRNKQTSVPPHSIQRETIAFSQWCCVYYCL